MEVDKWVSATRWHSTTKGAQRYERAGQEAFQDDYALDQLDRQTWDDVAYRRVTHSYLSETIFDEKVEIGTRWEPS